MDYLSLFSGYYTQLLHGQLPWGDGSYTGPLFKMFQKFSLNTIEYINKYEIKREKILSRKFEITRKIEIDDLNNVKILTLRIYLLEDSNVFKRFKPYKTSSSIHVEEKQIKHLRENENQLFREIDNQIFKYKSNIHYHLWSGSGDKINRDTRGFINFRFREIKKHLPILIECDSSAEIS